jgi:hypothetical protein
MSNPIAADVAALNPIRKNAATPLAFARWIPCGMRGPHNCSRQRRPDASGQLVKILHLHGENATMSVIIVENIP